MSFTKVFRYTAGQTDLYAYPGSASYALSSVPWLANRVLATELIAGLYSVTCDETKSEEWSVFDGTAVPADHDAAIVGLSFSETDSNLSTILTLLESGIAVTRTPVATNGKLTGPIIIGDSYQSENARAFSWLINPVSGVNVATVSCKFGAISGGCSDKQFIVSGTVEAVTVDAVAKWKLVAELAPEDTEDLPEDKYRWSVALVYSDGTQETRYYGDEWLKKAATR